MTDTSAQLKDLFGWLEKFGKDGLKLVKKRWFAYSPASGLLFYYASPSDAVPLGSYDIRTAAFRMCVDRGAEPGGVECEFEICLSKDRIVHLRAPSRDAALWWVTRLQRARKLLIANDAAKASGGEIVKSRSQHSLADSDDRSAESEQAASNSSAPQKDDMSASEFMLKEKLSSAKVRSTFEVGVESAQSERRSLADFSVKHFTTEVRNVVSRFKQRSKLEMNSRFYVDLGDRSNEAIPDGATSASPPSDSRVHLHSGNVNSYSESGVGDAEVRDVVIRAFEDQNAILNGEILELMALRKKDEEDIAKLLKKIVELERLFRDSELRYQRFTKYLAASQCPHCGKQLGLQLAAASRQSVAKNVQDETNSGKLLDIAESQSKTAIAHCDEERFLTQVENLGHTVDADTYLHDFANRELVDKYGFAASSRFSNDTEALLSAIREGESDREKQRDYESVLESRWDQLIIAQKAKVGRASWSSDVDFLERSDELRTLVRLGVPVKYRQLLWTWCVQKLLLNASQRDQRSYQELLSTTQQQKVDEVTRNQIEVDLFRTFSTNLHFRHDFQRYTSSLRRTSNAAETVDVASKQPPPPSQAPQVRTDSLIQLDDAAQTPQTATVRKGAHFDELLQVFEQPSVVTSAVNASRAEMEATAAKVGTGYAESTEIQQLRNILLAYCAHNTTVGYCQGLNRLAGLFLVVLGDEEQAFHALCALTECILPADYFSDTFQGLRKDLFVFDKLLAQKRPTLFNHLLKLGVDTKMFVCRWLLTCFLDSGLPTELILTIWDSLLYEGVKILFRFSLALLFNAERSILALNSTDAVLMRLQILGNEYKASYAQQLQLREVAFRSTNPLSMNLIKRLLDEFVDDTNHS